jgi:hypothetical protein
MEFIFCVIRTCSRAHTNLQTWGLVPPTAREARVLLDPRHCVLSVTPRLVTPFSDETGEGTNIYVKRKKSPAVGIGPYGPTYNTHCS